MRLCRYLTILTLWAPFILTQEMNEDGDDYFALPDPSRKCKPGSGFVNSDVECELCPTGSYNGDDMRSDKCMLCPAGSYSEDVGSTWCRGCNGEYEATTVDNGAVSQKQCADANEIIANFGVADVAINIAIEGKDLCGNGIDEALWGISGLAIFDAHFTECSYNDNISRMRLQMTLPSRYAMEFWKAMKFVEAHVQEANSWIELGDYYFRKIAFLINNLEGIQTWIDGLNINPDLLLIKDIKLAEFKPEFKAHCSFGRSGDFCESESLDPSMPDVFISLQYSALTGWEEYCTSNAGLTKLMNFVESEKMSTEFAEQMGRQFGCDDGLSCKLSFGSCSDKGVIIIVTINMDTPYAPTTKLTSTDTPFQFITGCDPGTVFIDDTFSKCGECNEGSYADGGVCKQCPFTTWGQDGKTCNSCAYGYETPFWGMGSTEMCMQIRGNWWDSNYEYIRPVAGQVGFDLKIRPTMNMCGVAEAMDELIEVCKVYGEKMEVNWEYIDQEMDIVPRTMCFVASNVVEAHKEMCGDDWSMTWEDLWRELMTGDITGGLNNIACFVLNPLVKLDGKDKSDDCLTLPKSDYTMSIEILLNGMTVGSEVAGVIVPLMTGFKNLERMDFSSFAVAGEAMMEEMGISDMEAFTGWRFANNVKDMVMEIVSGMSMEEFNFEADWAEEEFFCSEGGVKRECSGYCDAGSEMWNCKRRPSEMDYNLSCEYNECNNCATDWYRNIAGQRQEFACSECSFQDIITDGSLTRVIGDKTRAIYACDDGYAAKDCNYYASCNPTLEITKYSLPQCLRHDCIFPQTIEHGKQVEADRGTGGDGSCPVASYSCDQGFFLHGDKNAYCKHAEDNWHVNLPSCLENCQFPEIIEGGKLISINETGQEYYAEYECIDGFYPYSDWRNLGYCSVEYEGDKMMVVAKVPECRQSDTCIFPDSYNGAQKSREWTDNGRKFATYQCPEGMIEEGSSYAQCSGEMGEVMSAQISCYWGPKCEYQSDIDGGYYLTSSNGRAKYVCNYDWEMESEPWATCANGRATYPVCVRTGDSCRLPTHIDNGNMTEKELDKAQYKCNNEEGWKLSDSLRELGGWVYCDKEAVMPEVPRCYMIECDFDAEIENGFKTNADANIAYYECNKDFRLVGRNTAKCDVDQTVTSYPTCIKDTGACDFTDVDIKNGFINGTGDFWAKAECNFGYVLEGDWLVECGEDNKITDVPACVISCTFPDFIEYGYMVEKHTNQARYECKEGFKMEASDWMTCDPESGDINKYEDMPHCIREAADEGCHFPDHIDGGKKVMEQQDQDWAYYTCYRPLVMVHSFELVKINMEYRNMSVAEAYKELFGIAWCDRDSGKVLMPQCLHMEHVGHCGLPNYIDGGSVVEFHLQEGADGIPRPFSATYGCEEGLTMQKTVRGDKGWCRHDGSMELPFCEEYSKDVAFKLHVGTAKDKTGKNGKSLKGIVLAKEVERVEDRTSTEGWALGCSDGFNNYAAGAICRSFDFGGGVQIQPSKKMFANLPTRDFGWTKFSCNYDDTLVRSENCHAEEYEDFKENGASAMCFAHEIMAVQCFPKEQYNGLDMAVSVKKSKLTCAAKMFKQGTQIDMGQYDWKAKFFVDDREVTKDVTYKKKSGFSMANSRSELGAFKCVKCCIVDADAALMGETELCK